MRRWKYHVKVKHLFTEAEDHASIRESMTNIAGVLMNTPCFNNFSRPLLKKFHHIPKSNGVIEPIDYANKLLDKIYDYADANDIWIE